MELPLGKLVVAALAFERDEHRVVADFTSQYHVVGIGLDVSVA